METKQQGIQVRMRGDLAHTLKDGWRVAETSVTVEFLIQTEEGFEIGFDIERHAGLLERAHQEVHTALAREVTRRTEVEDAKRSPDGPQ